MSEIEFLTLVPRDQLRNAEVVYAGAAPGTHVDMLCRLFPAVHFTLVDPAPFTVRASERIDILRENFTDELARQLRYRFRDRVLLFISDIRNIDLDVDGLEEGEAKILSDMRAQQQWHVLMRPFRSMLKFRLPWDDGVSEYLAGDIYLPVWGRQSTTECRLITGVDSLARAEYNHKKYESQLFYFNCVLRPSLYSHGVCAEGVDHCYDCKAEVEILKRYLQLTPLHFPGENMNQKIANLSMDISRSVSSRRTLADPNPDKEERQRVIKRRQCVHSHTGVM
jgi:cap2 methyltransferase